MSDRIAKYKEARNFLSNRIIHKKVSLENYKKENSKFEEIKASLQTATVASDSLYIYTSLLSRVYKDLKAEEVRYKETRISEIDKEITNVLATVIPEEGFQAKIATNFKYRTERADLTLVTPTGHKRFPEISNGGMVQQMVGVGSSVAISRYLGLEMCLMDEAFSLCHPSNKPKLAETVKDMVDSGIQVIMIEQYDDGYRNLTRREFLLEKNIQEKKTYLLPYADY